MADVQFNNNADVIFHDTEDDVIWIHNVPSLTTQAGTDLAADSFTGNATITDHGGENASRRGICFTYDVAGDPTIADNVVYADGDFDVEAYFLSVAIDTGKSVRYRAYAVNNMGIGYGNTVQVLTLVIADPLVSVSALTGSLLYGLVVDPLTTEGALAAVEVLSFVNTEDFVLTYECTFNDLLLPIKSFSARFSTEAKSQVTVVVPDITYADVIADAVINNYDAGETILARVSVFIVKTYSSGNVVRERLTNIILEDIGYTEDVTMGAIKEIQLSGTLDETWSAKNITLSGASYRSIDGGYKSYRCSPDLYVRPGDTVVVNGDSFTVKQISWYIDTEQEMMTISEKAA